MNAEEIGWLLDRWRERLTESRKRSEKDNAMGRMWESGLRQGIELCIEAVEPYLRDLSDEEIDRRVDGARDAA